jgi:hypothetical protein
MFKVKEFIRLDRMQGATVLSPVKDKARGPAALLDLPCARRPAGGQIGTTG